ncbi:MAG: FadR/GntR family transcriptional regulator [Gammaproteobacteria bacterium]
MADRHGSGTSRADEHAPGGTPVGRRVAAYRARQKKAGIVHLSVMVRAEDAGYFREMAAASRKRRSHADTVARPGGLRESRPLSREHLKIAQRWAVRSGLKLRLNKPGWKLGDLLARNIAHEIVQGGWPVGHVLGTEADLMAQYGVSRGTFREAVRLLEIRSIAVMRRGVGGGLTVVEPDLDGAAYAVGVYLHSHRFSIDDLIETRKVVECYVLRRCVTRMNELARTQLRGTLVFEAGLDASASVSDLQRIHIVLARLSGDPSIILFVDSLLRASRYFSGYYLRPGDRGKIVAATCRAHSEIARALFAGDVERAQRAMIKFLDAEAGRLERP